MQNATPSDRSGWRVKYLTALIHLERAASEAAAELLESLWQSKPEIGEIKEALAVAKGEIPRSIKPLSIFKECLDTGEDELPQPCLSKNKRYVAAGSSHGRIWLWDLSTRMLLHVFDRYEGTLGPRYERESVRSVCLSHDNRYLLVGSNDGCLQLWEIATGRLVPHLRGS